ncbi:hypothetical protein ISCGN_006963 [Ixodes scapularis]
MLFLYGISAALNTAFRCSYRALADASPTGTKARNASITLPSWFTALATSERCLIVPRSVDSSTRSENVSCRSSSQSSSRLCSPRTFLTMAAHFVLPHVMLFAI